MSEDIKNIWTEEISKLLWKQAKRNRGKFIAPDFAIFYLICFKVVLLGVFLGLVLQVVSRVIRRLLQIYSRLTLQKALKSIMIS